MYSGKTAQFDFSKIAIVNEPSRHTTLTFNTNALSQIYVYMGERNERLNAKALIYLLILDFA